MMVLFTLILGIWLLPKAYSLQCKVCSPGIYGTCSGTDTTCSSIYNQCVATRLMIFAGTFKLVDIQSKKCAMTQDCVNGSINLGTVKIVTSSSCCNTTSCNSQDVSEPSSFTENGRRCLSCEGSECGQTLNCEKNEDYCVKSTMKNAGQKLTMKGCASKLMCLDESIAAIKNLTGADISCCQGDYCNSASSISAELLLLLLVPLASFILV